MLGAESVEKLLVGSHQFGLLLFSFVFVSTEKPSQFFFRLIMSCLHRLYVGVI